MDKRIFRRNGWLAGVLSVILCLVLVFSVVGVAQADDGGRWSNPYLVRTFVDEEGREIAEVIVPGRPPEIKAAVATVPEPNPAMGINVLSNVPAFDWSYGCSATSDAMLMGYYDNTGYSNMYAGPTNGGVCPMDNSVWGPGIGGSDGECPLSATHQGIDGRTTKGHVDDYWVESDSTEPDPFIGNWAEHTYGECTGDYMGTNQSLFGNIDGETRFYLYNDGEPLYDYSGCEPDKRDGCHGMRLFAESRGYTVVTNFSQYIEGQAPLDPNNGFTFEDFQAEIDAGRPVLIQVEGHTMLGYGYDTSGQIVYIHDTWDQDNHPMTWGGSYEGLQHYGVTVIQLESATAPNNPPQLSSGNVEPSSGHPSTDFYYYVNYYDSDGDSPTVKYVRIDGTAYPMSLYSGTASNGVYRYGPKNLAVGSHNYYFYFSDGKGGTARLPTSGSYSGPTISGAPPGAVEVSIAAPAEVAAGSDFIARVDIDGVENFDAANYDVVFDATVLRLDDVTVGEIDGTAIPVDIWNPQDGGPCTIVQNVPGLAGVTGSGTLAELHFHVIGAVGASSDIDLQNGFLGDNEANEIEATWTGDSVHVSSILPGDANGDGVVNSLDITKVERIIVGLDAETPGADANGDGVVNSLDITKVERIIVGLD